MAERRMFSKKIIMSDGFLDMPTSARCLYFYLAMNADDDGFLNNPRAIMRTAGATLDDMRLLLAKRFLLEFDSGVIVVTHWRIHNYIAKDRHKDTIFRDEMRQLAIGENKEYIKPENGGKNCIRSCIQDVYKMDTQDRLDKCSSSNNNNNNNLRNIDNIYNNNIYNTRINDHARARDGELDYTDIWREIHPEEVDTLKSIFVDSMDLIDAVHDYVKENRITIERSIFRYIVAYGNNTNWQKVQPIIPDPEAGQDRPGDNAENTPV